MTFAEWISGLTVSSPTPRGRAIISLQTDIAFAVMERPRNLSSLMAEMTRIGYPDEMADEGRKLWLDFCKSSTHRAKSQIRPCVKMEFIDKSVFASTGPAYTAEEDAIVRDGLFRGMSYAAIGEKIGRSGSSVGGRVRKQNLTPKELNGERPSVSSIPSIQNAYGVSVPYIPSLYREMPG